MEVPGGQGALRINTAPNILSYHYSGSTILECFLSISLQKSRSPVMAAQCSMYWHGGGVVFVFSPAGIRGNTEISIPARQIIACSYHQIYYRNRTMLQTESYTNDKRQGLKLYCFATVFLFLYQVGSIHVVPTLVQFMVHIARSIWVGN